MKRAAAEPSAIASPQRIGLWGVQIAIALAELWIVLSWIAGVTSLQETLVLHVLLSLFFIATTVRFGRDEAGGLLIDGLLLLLTGPLAAIEMMGRIPRRGGAPALTRPDLAPVSRGESLYADILGGRRAIRDPDDCRTLAARLRSGDLASQQFAVATISRAYRREMHPLLTAALASKTPAIRVQAAAVFAQLRERAGAQAKQFLDTGHGDFFLGAGADAIVSEATRCRDLAESPFLDSALQAALLERACVLEAWMALELPMQAVEPGRPLRRRSFRRARTKRSTGGAVASALLTVECGS